MISFRVSKLTDLVVDVSLTSVARGDVLYRGASKWNNLAAGAAGKVLTSGGSGADPSWQTPFSQSAADLLYQPIDPDLTAIAALTTTSFGRSLLTESSATTARSTLGVTATGADTTYAARASNLSDLASATTARSNLGLGTAATANTGTSGTTVPLLDGANTWSGQQTFAAAITYVGAAAQTATLRQVAPAQSTGAVAGLDLTIRASDARAGSSTVGPAIGGNLTLQAGDSAYLTSGSSASASYVALRPGATQDTNNNFGTVRIYCGGQRASGDSGGVSGNTVYVTTYIDANGNWYLWNGNTGRGYQFLNPTGSGSVGIFPGGATDPRIVLPTDASIRWASNMDGTTTGVVGLSMLGTGGLALCTPNNTTAPYLNFRAKSSTTDNIDRASLATYATDNTHASRKYGLTLNVYDTAARECMRIEASGSASMIGFHGSAAVVKPSITGSRGGNAALADLLTKLATYGLITDGTTA